MIQRGMPLPGRRMPGRTVLPERRLDPQFRLLVQLGQDVHLEPADLQRLVIADGRSPGSIIPAGSDHFPLSARRTSGIRPSSSVTTALAPGSISRSWRSSPVAGPHIQVQPQTNPKTAFPVRTGISIRNTPGLCGTSSPEKQRLVDENVD
ncbi:hypothetical protein [Actinoplanes hulinensis]|uniref:hypothetical protein n=1 Tax=Actinoplanes hulinensis TaxID=1144547 RepID=UPI003FD7AC4E